MKKVLAEVITIGDEILYGQTLDTNTQWIGQKLSEAGIRIIRKISVGDIKEEILKALDEAGSRADIILMTGGLGPTKDDITKHTLATYFNTPLVMNMQALQEVRTLFESRNRPMTPTNERQAELPEKCKMLSNTMGTAPGMWFEEAGKIFVSMPGVPHEMKAMMEKSVIPEIRKKFSLPVIYHQMIQTAGIGESWLADKIERWELALPAHIRLAYLPHFGRVRLRLTAFGEDIQLLKEETDEQVRKLLPLIEKYVYGFGETTLEEAIGKLLVKQHKTVAAAESCTGGYLGHTITRVPGSSRYFQGAVVPYHNALKVSLLDVKQQMLEKHGAVSEQTVTEMAQQVRTVLNADIGLASSGIAGPEGGTAEKPVGTIWIAIADGQQVHTRKLSLTKDRTVNIELTTVAILNLLRLTLTGFIDKED